MYSSPTDHRHRYGQVKATRGDEAGEKTGLDRFDLLRRASVDTAGTTRRSGWRPLGPWRTRGSRTMLGPSTERTAVSRIGSSARPGAASATGVTVLRGRVVTPSGMLDDGVV